MLNASAIGYLGKDAEVKNFGGHDYTVFSIGCNRRKKDGTEETQWVNCYKYGTNDKIRGYLKKGAKVFVSGDLSVVTGVKDHKTYTNVNVNVEKVEVVVFAANQSSEQTQQAQPVAQEPVSGEDMPF